MAIATRPIVVSAIGIALAYGLRLPGIVEPLGIDQGIFATIAWGLRRGLVIYRDVWDQKPPGIDLIYLAGFRMLGESAVAVFWLDFLASIATCAIVASIARLTCGVRTAWMAAALYAAGTLPAYTLRNGGFLERAVPETFIPVFVGAAVLFLLAAGDAKPSSTSAWLAGALLGCSALLKPTALMSGGPLALWCMWQMPVRERSRRVLDVFGGVAAILGATAAWLAWRGGLRDAWIAVVEYNRSYVAIGWSWRGAFVECARAIWLRVRSEPLWLLGGAALAGDLWVWISERRNGPRVMRVIWTLGIGAGIVANGVRFYNTYFLPLTVPLALAGAALIDRALGSERLPRLATAGLAVIAVVLMLRYGHIARLTEATKVDMAELMAKPDRSRHAEYLARFGTYNQGQGFSARANAELTSYVREHTSTADSIYILGMAPEVYFGADRQPANRFIWAGPVTFDLFQHPDFTLERLTGDLRSSAPELLILEHNTRDSLQDKSGDDILRAPAVQSLLTAYRFEARIEDFEIHRRQHR